MQMQAPPNRLEQMRSMYFRRLQELSALEDKLANTRRRLNTLKKEYAAMERAWSNLQEGFAQNIGEILRIVDDEKVIVKVQSGSRFLSNITPVLNMSQLKRGTRVTLDTITHVVMRVLPRPMDEQVYNMMAEDPGDVSFQSVGGLSQQIRAIREVTELPLTNPGLFVRLGITPPKGALLYGPPGTGKTLLARAVARGVGAKFLKTVASGIVDKYIGESARIIRDMFQTAREQEPCIIFMDEIDAIGGKRVGEGQSTDREIQRTLMELLAQLDGFDALGKVKTLMATNRPDALDPALMRPGRLDRKIEIPLPNETGRLEIIKIHLQKVTIHGDVDFEAIVKLSAEFNGADMRNIVTEAGMFAIKAARDFLINEDLLKATRKISDAKKLEGPAGGQMYTEGQK
eukprot:TRINITY_DN55702_c0_g1_i1.p1 TRINITY_DN55702_c0_g1~~TRINITY_DN55702_c0_g1_i1.p1  ORF type:complete len:401 (+),score=93.36 TRINITY_DN55702_c0_g1_i1:245-1447(+)